MIYPISNKQQTRNKKQAGVTLILAILVLSSLMAISFSLATILFIEVRSSSDVLRTEGAYYATNGVTEQALFNYKRNLPAGSLSYSTSFGSVTATTPVTKVYGDAILQDVVPKNQTFQNTSNHYALFNVGNPSGIANPPAFPLGGSGYSKISITYLDTGNPDSLSIYICQFDPLELVDPNGTGSNTYQSVPCTNPAHASDSPRDYWLVNGTDISGKLDHGLNNIYFLDPTKMQELILVNNGNSAQDMYVKIQTFIPDPVNPGQFIAQGLPYFSKNVVDISATNSTVTRKLRVIIPSSSGTSAGVLGSAVGYAHHRQITINSGQVPSPQASFPVLINITDAATMASLKSAVISPQGYDIQFAQNSDGSGALNFEIESYDSSTGKLVAWVSVPTIADGATFNMFYGKNGAVDQSNKSAVWGGSYRGVWHLPNGSSLTAGDSTGNNNATINGAAAAAGQIGGSGSFNGTSAYLEAADSPSLNLTSNNFTFSAWINPGSNAGCGSIGSPFCIIFNKEGTYEWAMDNSGNIEWAMNNTSPGWAWVNTLLSVPLNQWTLISLVYNGSNVVAYKNGVSPISSSATGNIVGDNNTFRIGARNGPGLASSFFPGKLDELRISGNALSSDWIKTEYNNEIGSGFFYILGAEQTP